MDCYLTLILLVFGLSLNSCSQIPPRKYYYVSTPMNWNDAQKYCREKYTDLARIENDEDSSRLPPAFTSTWAWIGLYDDPKSWKGVMGNDTNSWRWSATGETSKTGYGNWADNEPNNAGAKESCVIMSSGKWRDAPCESLYSFVCFKETALGGRTYVFISSKKTWDEAQTYCREHHTDLTTMENDGENTEVQSTTPANEIWIGLYRVQWTWTDKTQSPYRKWQDGKPNNGNQYCMAVHAEYGWDDGFCEVAYSFLCHQDVRLKTVVKMKIQTDADMTDPAVNTQFLQQLDAELRRQELTDFKLQWNAPPKKQEKEELTHPQCSLDG